jgi:hypothetical protein
MTRRCHAFSSKKCSWRTFHTVGLQSDILQGLAELEPAQIIAKHMRQGWYFINPNFVFNGDRVAFTAVIERKSKPPDVDIKESETPE